MTVLNVVERGVGPSIVLLHGLAGSAQLWERQFGPLVTAGWHVIAMDLRGHGGSTDEGRNWSITNLADDVLDTLDRLGIVRFGLVGHSLGGRVMWSLALNVQPRVEFLVPVGAQSEAPSGLYRRVMTAWRQALLDENGLETFTSLFESAGELPARIKVDAEYADEYRQRFSRNRPAALVSCIDAILSMPSYTAALSGLTCPVLSVVGENDVNFLESSRQYLATIPVVTKATIPGCAHYPMVDQVEVFNVAILGFLREVRARCRPMSMD